MSLVFCRLRSSGVTRMSDHSFLTVICSFIYYIIVSLRTILLLSQCPTPPHSNLCHHSLLERLPPKIRFCNSLLFLSQYVLELPFVKSGFIIVLLIWRRWGVLVVYVSEDAPFLKILDRLPVTLPLSLYYILTPPSIGLMSYIWFYL